MILATYQPANIDFNKHITGYCYEKLCDILGYTPIWCFPANTLKEFMVNSIMSAPNTPQDLYVFETDDFIPIDVVKWNQLAYLHNNDAVVDVSSCLKVENLKYAEYIVNDIPEDKILFHGNIHNLIYNTKFSLDFGGEESSSWTDLMNSLASRASEFSEHSKRNMRITGSGDLEKARRILRLRMEKEAFEVYLAWLLVSQALPSNSLSEAFSWKPERYFSKRVELSSLLTSNYNGDDLPTYERQDQILSLLNYCFINRAPWGDKKIGRNDPCPCGSGKKYKNCCGKNA